ncbi:MAG TPA: DNA polymerase III subunit beta, partial [Actinomycetota bacterium]|nr:DNA polymerase III subunit beta [Actinomycetota bacterium]
MKLICPTDELSKALQTVLRSVGARAGIPALSGVLLELDDTQLTLTTTDLEITTRVTLPVTGEAGKLVVPARYLAEIVRNLPSDEVELVTEDGTVRIAGGRARYSLRSLPAEDFPRTEPGDGSTAFTVPGDVLSQALGQVAPAASRDETRPV